MHHAATNIHHENAGKIGVIRSIATGAVQNPVIEFLSSPDAFEDQTGHVDVITTHGAMIFLGDRQAYKIKQAVEYDYMDFSTLEKRRKVCEREFEINRPVAPSIYLDVVAITRNGRGKLAINGDGKAVEWAILMNRFAEEDVLERIAESGNLTSELAAQLGNQIADYHHALPRAKTQDGAERISEIIDELNDAFADPDLKIPQDLAAEFRGRAAAILEAEYAHLDIRAKQGFVRRCHGDLHLRNIVMLEGVPTPFDALEFDERLATTDILYDLAFLIMDMLHRNLHTEANVVFNRYVYFSWSLIEAHGFQVLPLFLGLRAAIRAMVCAQTAQRDPASSTKLKDETEKYLTDSIAFLEPQSPKLVAIGGLSGTGKSTISAALAPLVGELPGALLLRSDLERKKMLGAEEYERLPVEAYNPTANRHVYERIFDKARIALMQGHSVVLDAVFSDAENRHRAAEIAQKLNVSFCGNWLDAPADVLIERVSNRGKDASDAGVEVVKKQISSQHSASFVAAEGWQKIDASGSVDNTLKNANLRFQRAFRGHPRSSFSTFHAQ